MSQSRGHCCVRLAQAVVISFSVAFSFAAEDRPNILLVVADDLGFSDLGCYGGEIDTPVLNSLAADGVIFTRMYSTGRCCPSRAALLTGQYPHSVGLGHMTIDLERPGYRGSVAENAKTIADVLKRAGYRTWIAGKWHLGTTDPTQHGFGDFFGTLVSCKDFWSPKRFYCISRGRERAWERDSFHATDAVTDYALEFLSQSRRPSDQPWFGYLAYHAPHFPLHASRDDISKYEETYKVGWDEVRAQRLRRMRMLGRIDSSVTLPERSRYADWAESDSGRVPAWESLPIARRKDLARRMAIYAAMVDRMDRQFGRIIDDIAAAGERENTLIIFLSDNGACAEWDPFGFDGVSGPENRLHVGDELDGMGQPGTFHSVGAGWAMASNTPFRRYKHYCHEGGIRGPCVVSWPAGLSGRLKGSQFERPVHLIDIFPTVAAVAGAGDLGPLTPAGLDLGPVLQNEAAGAEGLSKLESRDLFFEHEGNRAILSGRYKLVAVRGQPWELFALEGRDADPTESLDLVRRPELATLCDDLAERWTRWAAATDVTPLPVDYGVEYLPESGAAGRELMQDNAVGLEPAAK